MTIENVLTRRQILNQRFAGGQAAEAEKILKRIYNKIEARLLREPTQFQDDRMRLLRADINQILNLGFEDMKVDITDGVLAFADAEAQFMFTALSAETTVILALPAIEQIQQAVLQAGMGLEVGTGTLTIN